MLAAACGLAQPKSRPVATRPPASPQRIAAAPADHWPIQSLTVEGSRHFTQQELLAVAGLKIGQIAGKDEFEAARERLLATAAFETVGYRFEPAPDGKGYAASFQVTEVEILPVRFDELGVPDAALEAALRARDPLFSMKGLPASQPVIARHVQWIQEYLTAQGSQVKVSGGVAPWPEAMTVVFRPDGALPAVVEVTFEGNQALSEDDLRKAIAGAAVGLAYTEPRFRDVLNNSVVPAYEAHGFITVAFPKIRTEPVESPRGIKVFVSVIEGPTFKLGKVSIPNPAPVKSEDLLKAGRFETGETANFDHVNTSLSEIRQLLNRVGYLDAQVAAGREIHDDEKTVDLALRVDAGPQYTMGSLNVTGLDLSAEAEIRRIWTIKPGKPFNPEYPDLFLATIRDQGMFDNLGETKADVRKDGTRHTADITLTFGAAKKPVEDKPKGPGGPFGVL